MPPFLAESKRHLISESMSGCIKSIHDRCKTAQHKEYVSDILKNAILCPKEFLEKTDTLVILRNSKSPVFNSIADSLEKIACTMIYDINIVNDMYGLNLNFSAQSFASNMLVAVEIHDVAKESLFKAYNEKFGKLVMQNNNVSLSTSSSQKNMQIR